MRKLLALSLSPLALGLAAYAGAADSPAAGQPLYVAALATTPVYARDTRHSGGKTVLVLANTGGQTVISVDLKAQPYFRGIPLKDASSTLQDFAVTTAIPSAKVLTTHWAMAGGAVDCVRITQIDVRFADGSRLTVDDGKIDAYMASGINRHCASASIAGYPDAPQYQSLSAGQPLSGAP